MVVFSPFPGSVEIAYTWLPSGVVCHLQVMDELEKSLGVWVEEVGADLPVLHDRAADFLCERITHPKLRALLDTLKRFP
jgi:hypothetical protein